MEIQVSETLINEPVVAIQITDSCPESADLAEVVSLQYSISGLKHLVSGGFGGACGLLTGHPLDTVKVRLQTQPIVKQGEKPLFSGMVDCLKKTVKNEGFKGLYRGIAPPIIFSSSISSIIFCSYNSAKSVLDNQGDELSFRKTAVAGGFAGFAADLVATPVERIKCLLQVQQADKKNAKYNGCFHCVKMLYQTEGIRGLYRGICATFLRDIPGFATYFVTYESIIQYFTSCGKSRYELNPMTILFAGGLSGTAYWVVCIAPDTLKSRYQIASREEYPRGIRDVFKQLVKTESYGALFKGFTPVMFRSFPVNGVVFFGYETAMSCINWLSLNYYR